jgi:hypothetical protein
MLEVIDATNTDAMNVIESSVTEFTPETTDPQTEIGEAITNLWVAHANAKIAARATNEELRALRGKLGEQLSEMKRLLAKPGCDGQWSGFLRERNIPRATADRLVARHQRSIDPNANCATEDVSEPTDADVQKLFIAVWPKIRRTLRSRQSVDLFVRLLTSQFESCQVTDQEISVATPATEIPDLPSLDGDSSVPPQSYDALPPEIDQGVICSS